MSVPEGKRGESIFEPVLNARNLASYTIHICKNPKVFQPEYQTALGDSIIQTAKDIFILAFGANGIRVTENAETAKRRIEQQNKAIEACNNLLALIQLAKSVYHLPSKRVKHWGAQTIDTRASLQRWRDADKKRYASQLRESK